MADNTNTDTPAVVGRPSKLTDDVISIILKAISLGSSQVLAAQSAGIHPATFSDWMKQGRENVSEEFSSFYGKVKKAEGDRASTWLQHIEDAATKGTWTAAAWKLERIYPDDFGKQDRVTVHHSPQLVTFQWQPQLAPPDDDTEALEGHYTLLTDPDDDNEEPED